VENIADDNNCTCSLMTSQSPDITFLADREVGSNCGFKNNGINFKSNCSYYLIFTSYRHEVELRPEHTKVCWNVICTRESLRQLELPASPDLVLPNFYGAGAARRKTYYFNIISLRNSLNDLPFVPFADICRKYTPLANCCPAVPVPSHSAAWYPAGMLSFTSVRTR
jgi:hypothetical protein